MTSIAASSQLIFDVMRTLIRFRCGRLRRVTYRVTVLRRLSAVHQLGYHSGVLPCIATRNSGHVIFERFWRRYSHSTHYAKIWWVQRSSRAERLAGLV